ncbi:MAG TPA: TIGR00725 family protein [Chloroflexota bacterium]
MSEKTYCAGEMSAVTLHHISGREDTVARMVIAVVGSGECDARVAAMAREIGMLIAQRGTVLVTGGSTGVMEAASQGAHEAGGLVVGILPGLDVGDANPWVDVAIPTGMGQLRNGLVVNSASAVIAVAGEWGTLSEIGLARKAGKTVIGLQTWRLSRPDGAADDIVHVDTPAQAVERAFSLSVR